MALFIVYHKWKKENFKVVTKKVLESVTLTPPKGSALVCSYLRADMTGAVVIWQGKSAEQIQDYIRNLVPEMETDVVPALQFFPPGPDLYTYTHALIS